MKKSELINLIQSLKTFQSPKAHYEQYYTDAIATADIFYHIAFERQDLNNRLVIDLGCGGGNLSIAAAVLGAPKTIGIDIDPEALSICQENIDSLQLNDKITLIQGDLTTLKLEETILNVTNWDTLDKSAILVVSNPPFGVKRRGIDVIFLKQAISISNLIYSLHLSHPQNREFLIRKISQLGGRVDHVFTLQLVLKHSYSYHKKKQKYIHADLFRIIKL
ncbi:MAG: hypothetical protein DRO88_07545 [Promethearchaeia archaeon]|nr:MAG: hypothetical protein DRO88_07545 [Candidatus Lokiarchaeia archaeon]